MVKTAVFVESLSSLFIAFRDGKKAEKRILIGIPPWSKRLFLGCISRQNKPEEVLSRVLFFRPRSPKRTL